MTAKANRLFLVAVIISSALADRQVPQISIRTGPLAVSYGRTLQLDPQRHLTIAFPDKCKCEISVVRDDPLSERTGYLTPERFPCKFVKGDVRFVHLGSKAPSKDFVKISVRVDSPTETYLRRGVLDVTVDFKPMEIVTKNAGLVIRNPGGTSSPIDGKVLHVKYDAKVEACRIIALDKLDSEKGLPRYGRLVNISRSADLFAQPLECATFLSSDIRYVHRRSLLSPNRDYIPMMVEIHRNGDYVEEFFHVAVMIRGARPNNRPSPTFMSSKFMSVQQFVMKLITIDVLDAEDQETKADHLIFNVTQPLGPGEGLIVSTDDPHSPITSFYRKDLRDLKIAYMPPVTVTSTTRAYEVVFEAIDTEATHSEPIKVVIKVWPRNTLSPTVTKNKALQLFEGQSRIISSKDNLQISDEDNIKDVKIEVVGGLRHGELYVNRKVARKFTPEDLDNGRIIYQHDNSDTYSDNIILNATDGERYVEFAFVINVLPVDDQHPVLVHNTGLQLDKNSMALIDEYALGATDIDSDINMLVFHVLKTSSDQAQKPGLLAGHLMLRRKTKPNDSEDWVLKPDSFYEKTAVKRFTQEDVVRKRLFYVHNGAEIFEDRFYFVLVDNSENPNLSPEKVFHISVNQVDIKFPQIHPDSTGELNLQNSQKVKLTKDVLWFTDPDSDDRELLYTITRAPYFVLDTNETHKAGVIVSSEEPIRVLFNFTQKWLLHQKVAYKPPAKFNSYNVQFEYSVSDPVGHTVDNQIFKITLKPKSNIQITKLRVNEAGMLCFSSSDGVVKPEKSHSQQFIIVSPPAFGKLYKNGFQLDVGESFTLEDLTKKQLLYVQDGQGVKTDEVKIRLHHGTETTTFQIQAASKSKHDNVRIVAKKFKPSLVKKSSLSVEEAGSASITSKVLQATDPDSDDLKLIFMVNSFPKRGELLVNGTVANNFTQEDVIKGLVTYRHDMSEVGMNEVEDFFNLTVSDDPLDFIGDGTHTNTGFTFHVKISPVDNKRPTLKINAPVVVLEGSKVTMTSKHILVTDVDTRAEGVTCEIDTGPSVGFLENIAPARGKEQSREGIAISSFTVRDLLEERINYVQNDHLGREPKVDIIALSCSDGVKTSLRHLVRIRIVGQNDEVPKLFSTDFSVKEGGSMIFDSVLLNVEDKDVPRDNLTIKLVKAPQHGNVVDRPRSPSKPITSFPFRKIGEKIITYNHDGTDTSVDILEFAVFDGKHEVRKDVRIFILPEDDETPRLVTNKGMYLTSIGQTRMLSSSTLRAEDVDSALEKLTFKIRSLPKEGQLAKYSANGTFGNLTIGSTFKQKDINEGMIYYTDHSQVAKERAEIRFDVTDGTNSLINQVFYINMKLEDKAHPVVQTKSVHLRKGSSVTLTTDIINARDPDSPDEKLVYYIKKLPTKGIIAMADQPKIPIRTFTQLQLAGNMIIYVHTSSDGSKLDSFDFEASDGKNAVTRKLPIWLIDGDNTHTVVTYSRLSVSEGKTKEITSFELKAEDLDTKPASLLYSITQIPVNGFIMKRSTPTMTFTQEDIDNNLISYKHDGSDTTHDSLSLTITDGTHVEFYVFPDTKTLTKAPLKIEIDITPIDNKMPQVIINRGGTTLEMLPGGALGLHITGDLLKAVDPDSNNTQLKYEVSIPPDHGVIGNSAAGNRTVTTFLQDEINKGQIFYILNEEAFDANADRFYFDLVDPGKNKLRSQMFSMHWSWISLDRSVNIVSEIDRLVVVTLTRTGFLGESSFVAIGAVSGSATIHEDFVPTSAEQVQFNPGERFKTWAVLITDDKQYEGEEQFTVKITSPVMAILGQSREATVKIRDPEDRPVVSVSKLNYFVEENSGSVEVMLFRHGDASKQDQVMCITHSGTAFGTKGSRVESYCDFISKSQEKKSIVVFNKGERIKNCSVTLIDDSSFENEEEFTVLILPSLKTIVSSRYNKSVVLIKPDINDEPRMRFRNAKYVVDENSDEFKVTVERTGTDLSRPASVVVRSKRTNPISARANMDYIPVSKTVYFPPNVNEQTVEIVILDDLGKPVREGPEYFELALALPINGRLAMPDRTLVVINDSYSDLPTIQFDKTSYIINEEDAMVFAILVRSGDLRMPSAVRCYTRQLSARAGVDYSERASTDQSVVTFAVGEKRQECRVKILDDPFYEGDETFRLVLGEPKIKHGVGRNLIGERSQTIVTIKDKNDRSGIGFERKRYFVNEPKGRGQTSSVTLTVLRNGDTSKTSVVRLYTKGGSAEADKDFSPLSKVLIFKKNVTRIEVKIKVLADNEREMREAFTVHLTKDRNRVALIEGNKVIVYIQENLHSSGVTFPLIPTVVSLRDYDDVSKAPAEPIHGYPVICVTACDPKHPRYPETGSLCARQSIDNSRTWYSWEVAAATEPDGVTNYFRSLDSETFFAKSNMITLDSVYFGRGSRVRCTARAMTYENYKGLTSTSNAVTISRKDGLCLPRRIGDIGSEPFSAQITYTGSEDINHPNMIRVQVLIPHIDGMLPAISTKSLSNFEITLTTDASRRGQHLCSNLLDANEVQTKSGFLTDYMKDSHVIGGTEPYQYSSELRGNSTLRFYRNLNLEACMWTFENHYTMSELVQECGGRISTDGQVRDLTRSHLSVRVPLYVSYIYHSPSALGGWMHFDHSSHLKMSFTYDTAVLWKDGIGTSDGSDLKGYFYDTSIRIRPQDKRLVVNFRTVARFRGIFIMGQEDQNVMSMVMSPNQPNLGFKLKLLRSSPTYNSPEQMWQFVSEFSVRDYSGTYYIKLIPCTVTQNVKYSVPLECNPRIPITFTLPIRFQQTSDPDALEFNVRTQFVLLAREDVWLSNKTEQIVEQSDAAFSLGSVIYGRVMVDPKQSLGSAYHVSVEKVFVCSGLDGYTPQYNPDSNEYGCLADSNQLSYRFKILDRGAPHKITPKFRNVPFVAMLAIDDTKATPLVEQPNSDGFRFDSSPLFQVSSGRQWYLHAIYTIRSSHSSTRGIGKRSTTDEKEYSHVVHSMSKRALSKEEEPPKGATLLRSITLNYPENDGGEKDDVREAREKTKRNDSSQFPLKWVLVAVVTICVILIIVVIVLLTLYRRKSPPVTANVVVHGDSMQGTEV